MQTLILPACFGVALLSAAHAQLPLYDAGILGNPVVAPNPATQGWSLDSSAGAQHTAISPDPGTGLNAWQVTDTVGSGNTPGRFTWPLFSAGQVNQLYSRGFELTAIMRMLPGGTDSMHLAFADGVNLANALFQVNLQVSGPDVIATDRWAGTPFLCLGAMDGAYHHFALRYVPSTFSMVFVYDGQVLGPVDDGFPDPSSTRAVSFGSDFIGTGSARFHRVELGYLDALGSSYCTPAASNSTGNPGRIDAFGSEFETNDLVTLTASQLPPGSFGFFLNSRGQASVPNPGGSQGTLCLGGGASLGRHNRPHELGTADAAGQLELTLDLDDLPTALGPRVASPGETWNFQLWYRDQNPTATSNFTNALSITFR